MVIIAEGVGRPIYGTANFEDQLYFHKLITVCFGSMMRVFLIKSPAYAHNTFEVDSSYA